MKAMNSAMVFQEANLEPEETVAPSIKAAPLGGTVDHYDEPGFFFKGAFYGLLFCLPFWAVICWLII